MMSGGRSVSVTARGPGNGNQYVIRATVTAAAIPLEMEIIETESKGEARFETSVKGGGRRTTTGARGRTIDVAGAVRRAGPGIGIAIATATTVTVTVIRGGPATATTTGETATHEEETGETRPSRVIATSGATAGRNRLSRHAARHRLCRNVSALQC